MTRHKPKPWCLVGNVYTARPTVPLKPMATVSNPSRLKRVTKFIAAEIIRLSIIFVVSYGLTTLVLRWVL